ncbi:hypothetical protein ACFQZF_08155 [Flavobacterium myungsuense]|uniref:Uncharacterized protein n=1 Tax=Flavobacterium myungsuense TaxID=651823 RepID=A0ABW3J531_9FLAO
MKQIAVIAFIFLFSLHCLSQSEFQNKSNSFKPIGPNTVKPSPTPVAPSVFKLHTKPEPYTSKFIEEKNKIQFTNTNDFKNPGDIYKEKLNKKLNVEGYGSAVENKDFFFGEFVVTTERLLIACRDKGEIDGDNVCIWVNGEKVAPLIYLEGSFKKYYVELKMNRNTIEIEALGTGLIYPNTGQFTFFDGNEKLVTNQDWNLNSGYKAIIRIRRINGLELEIKK